MDSMIKMAMAIEREIEDARSIRDTVASGSGKKQKTSIPRGFQGQGHGYQGQG